MISKPFRNKKLIINFFLTLNSAILIQLFLMLKLVFSSDTNIQVPWTFSWVWIITAIICIYFFVARHVKEILKFIIITYFGYLISFTIWFCVPEQAKNILANFSGIECRLSNETINIDDSNQEYYIHQTVRGNLFNINNVELFEDLKEKSERYSSIEQRKFIFWQTGLATGFKPKGIVTYDEPKTFIQFIGLFFTVGPIVLVECILLGFYNHFFILVLIHLFWNLYRKENIWM
jgi:hypothetical protein